MFSLDKVAIRAAVAANPSIPNSVAHWVESVSGEPLTQGEREGFKNALIDALTVGEALSFRSLPASPSLPALLSQRHFDTVLKVVSRMPEPHRSNARSKIERARQHGRLEVRHG